MGKKLLWTVSTSLLDPQSTVPGLTEISFPMPIWLRLGFMPVPICQIIASAGWVLKGHSLAWSSYHIVLLADIKEVVDVVCHSRPYVPSPTHIYPALLLAQPLHFLVSSSRDCCFASQATPKAFLMSLKSCLSKDTFPGILEHLEPTPKLKWVKT